DLNRLAQDGDAVGVNAGATGHFAIPIGEVDLHSFDQRRSEKSSCYAMIEVAQFSARGTDEAFARWIGGGHDGRETLGGCGVVVDCRTDIGVLLIRTAPLGDSSSRMTRIASPRVT